MTLIEVEGFRCFRSKTRVAVRPLTLCMGENSSGKSAFLAAFRLLWDSWHSPTPEFNEAPFLLGSWETIAHYHGGQARRVKTFTLGARTRPPAEWFRNIDGLPRQLHELSPEVEFQAHFKKGLYRPEISSWILNVEDLGVTLESTYSEGTADSFLITAEETEFPTQFALAGFISTAPPKIQVRFARQLSRIAPEHKAGTEETQSAPEAPRWVDQVLATAARAIDFALSESRPVALAPVRSQPERTYDPTAEGALSPGDRAPSELARRLLSRKQTTGLARAVLRLGRDSGLYSQIKARRFNQRRLSDPFQLEAKIPGQRGDFNIVDVGYGISQILPIAVETLLEPDTPLLVQQPEVHLHPRAQAALGSFFSRATGERTAPLLVETHSDHLVDRVRLAIKQEAISPSAVSLVFFGSGEHTGSAHNIELDKFGMPQNPPPNYRQFFLDEARALLK